MATKNTGSDKVKNMAHTPQSNNKRKMKPRRKKCNAGSGIQDQFDYLKDVLESEE